MNVMPTITKAMKQDAVDTARGYIDQIGSARSTGEANWLLGQAHGVLKFAQVWSVMDGDTVCAMIAQAHQAFRKRSAYLRGAL